MGNPTLPDFEVDSATFEATHALKIADLKEDYDNRGVRLQQQTPEADIYKRFAAVWANFIDDVSRVVQHRLSPYNYASVQVLSALGVADGIKVGCVRMVASGERYRCTSVGPPSVWEPVRGIRYIDDFAAVSNGAVVGAGAGVTGTDNTAAIQAAIDAANAAGGGMVAPKYPKTYRCDSTITLKANVTLYLPRGSRLALGSDGVSGSNDVNFIEFKKAASIAGDGGRISTVGTTDYSSYAVYLDGDQQFNYPDRSSITGVVIEGNDTDPTGSGSNGLYLWAHGGANHYVSYVYMQNILVTGFEFGARLRASDPGAGEQTWVSNNTLRDVQITNCVFFLDIVRASTSACTFNVFAGSTHVKSGSAYGNKAIRVDGEYNRLDVHIWDWSGQAATVNTELSSISGKNRVRTNVIPAAITSLGTLNVLDSTEIPSRIHGSVTIGSPPSIAAGDYYEEFFTVTGVSLGDCANKATFATGGLAGYFSLEGRVTAQNAAKVIIRNHDTVARTPPAGLYRIQSDTQDFS